MSVVALVPAKLTSVRTPKKNIADLAGLPLFVHSVRTAKACPDIDDVVVSSEASEVLDIANKEQVITFSRSKELSLPHVTNLAVMQDVVSQLEAMNKQPDIVVLLQPTHPFRNIDELSKAIQQFKAAPDASNLISSGPLDKIAGKIKNNVFTAPDDGPIAGSKKRLSLQLNLGNFYLYRVTATISAGTMYGPKVLNFELAHPEADVDIDYPWNLQQARLFPQWFELWQNYVAPGSSWKSK